MSTWEYAERINIGELQEGNCVLQIAILILRKPGTFLDEYGRDGLDNSANFRTHKTPSAESTEGLTGLGDLL